MSLLRRPKRERERTEARAPQPELPPPTPSTASASDALWVDKYAPTSVADLAMHKKKVDEIRQWLTVADTNLQLGLPPYPRMLVLSGPPGSGKSTMLRVLASEMQFELCEWQEPRTQRWMAGRAGGSGEAGRVGLSDPDEYVSRAAQFEAFLRSSLRTLSLCLTSSSTAGSRRRLVLLDELASGIGSADGDSPLQRQQARHPAAGARSGRLC